MSQATAYLPFHTPLRYPGGKRKLINYIKLLFHENALFDSEYVEPFAGGAGVAIALLLDEYASHVHINDLSRPVFAFWNCVLNATEELCRRIHDTAVTMDEWHRQRAVLEAANDVTLEDLGFATFFLNRTNRSGILWGGVIGGKGQTGQWKLDARYNKVELIRRIKKISRYRSRISLYNEDAAHFLGHSLHGISRDAFVYLDPPYYVKGEGLYENFYSHGDHIEIARLVAQIGQKWIVSYDAAPEIQEVYAPFRSILYSLSYSAADRYRGSEVMFFCPTLQIPDVENPAKVSTKKLVLRRFSCR